MTHFEQELDQLKQKLLQMSAHADSVVSRAVQSLVDHNTELALAVQADDKLMDDLEVEIDEMAISLLAKAPLASDLRLITVAMRICHDLERVGDEATKIARRSIELDQEPQLKEYIDIPKMARLALAMLREAMESFVNHDPAG